MRSPIESLAALVLAAATQGSPSPAALAPPQIIDVRTHALCATLSENIRPAVATLAQNDTMLTGERKNYEKLARDLVGGGSHALALDRLLIESRISTLVANLAAADTLLADAKRFPASPGSSDEKLATQIKTQLQAVVDEQKDMLNLVNGVIETDRLGEMQSEFSDHMPNSKPTQAPPTPQTGSSSAPATNAGVSAGPAADLPGADPRKTGDTGLMGNTLYGKVAEQLLASQTRATQLTKTAQDSIAVAAARCQVNPAPPQP